MHNLLTLHVLTGVYPMVSPCMLVVRGTSHLLWENTSISLFPQLNGIPTETSSVAVLV